MAGDNSEIGGKGGETPAQPRAAADSEILGQGRPCEIEPEEIAHGAPGLPPDIGAGCFVAVGLGFIVAAIVVAAFLLRAFIAAI